MNRMNTDIFYEEVVAEVKTISNPFHHFILVIPYSSLTVAK